MKRRVNKINTFTNMAKVNRTGVFFVLAFFFSVNSFAQFLVTNKGAIFHAATGAVVQINGNTRTEDSSFYNLGKIAIEGNFQNDGLTENNGQIYVAGNWINNSRYKRHLGYVNLDGNVDQYVGGDSVTHFYNLEISHNAIKFLDVDAYVHNTLTLNDRELNTQDNKMIVTNIDPNAILRTSGFVSSDSLGWLVRATLLPMEYLFPVGSSAGVDRYRPVKINPNPRTANIDTFAVRFVNHSADLSGYDLNRTDTTICTLNPLYYHLIGRPFGADSADIHINYQLNTDNFWDGIAHWDDTIPASGYMRWGSTGNNLMFPTSTATNNKWVKSYLWHDYVPTPFVLSLRHPVISSVSGKQQLCANDNNVMYTVTGTPNGTFHWSINGGIIESSPDNDTVYVSWNNINGTGTISCVETIVAGSCASKTKSFSVTISKPDANFVIGIDTTLIFTQQLIPFIDSSHNATIWEYNFGDGLTVHQQNPYHTYDNLGSYDVTLIVKDNNGCLDTTIKKIELKEGLIPSNVITPNGDGKNDDWEIKNSGLIAFELYIYNRWGNLIFETNNANSRWAGRTVSGGYAPNGTYYYIIDAKSDTKSYKMTGFITLLRD